MNSLATEMNPNKLESHLEREREREREIPYDGFHEVQLQSVLLRTWGLAGLRGTCSGRL